MGDKNPKKLKKKKQERVTPVVTPALPVEPKQRKGQSVKNKP